jgi:DNA-binding NarL/FixJ family response regulator
MNLDNLTSQNANVFKILLVEDSKEIASRVYLMLEEIPNVIVVGFADNVNNAVDSINKYAPDLVVLDIQLHFDTNSKTGIDLLRIIKNSYPNIETIMLSNHSEPHYIDICLNLGARYFLDKTLDFDKLPEKIIETFTLKENLTG